MRKAELHLPWEAIDAMGFDATADGFREAEVRDITLLSCEGPESLAVLTYSQPVDDALTDAEYVTWWERLDREGTGATYLCRTVALALRDDAPSGRERNLVVRSVTPEDAGCTLTLVGSQAALQCQHASGGDVDARVSLRRLTDYHGPDDDLDALTRRQREVLETAYKLGYYEVPRETTADEVARRLDLDRSTVTEHLQRAERNLLSAVLSG